MFTQLGPIPTLMLVANYYTKTKRLKYSAKISNMLNFHIVSHIKYQYVLTFYRTYDSVLVRSQGFFQACTGGPACLRLRRPRQPFSPPYDIERRSGCDRLSMRPGPP